MDQFHRFLRQDRSRNTRRNEIPGRDRDSVRQGTAASNLSASYFGSEIVMLRYRIPGS
jgi:hypothetical protein